MPGFGYCAYIPWLFPGTPTTTSWLDGPHAIPAFWAAPILSLSPFVAIAYGLRHAPGRHLKDYVSPMPSLSFPRAPSKAAASDSVSLPMILSPRLVISGSTFSLSSWANSFPLSVSITYT